MEERKTESLDEAIDELLSLGYLRYAEPDRLLETVVDDLGGINCCNKEVF